MAQGMVFEDIFNVKDIDPNGKQFDRGNFMIIIIFSFGYLILIVITINSNN